MQALVCVQAPISLTATTVLATPRRDVIAPSAEIAYTKDHDVAGGIHPRQGRSHGARKFSVS